MIKILILIIGNLALYNNYRWNRLLSSSSIWLAVYILIFAAYPLMSDEIYQHESEIDFFALVGIVMFCYGSYISSVIAIPQKFYFFKLDQKYPSFDFAFRLYIFFAICFLLSLLMAFGQGGVASVLRGSITAKQMVLDDSLNISTSYLLFLQLLFPCTLVVWVSQNNKVQKFKSWVCLAVYFLLTIMFAFTRLFAICLLGILMFYQMRNKNRKTQLVTLSIGSFALAALMVSMNFIRTIGLGQISSLQDWINVKYILESTDFSASYYYFDSLLNFESPYINPIVWLKAIYAFVPRDIWLTKPDPLSLQVLRYTNPALAATGYSTAGNSVLGEGYAIMGMFGIAVFPFIWGCVCRRLDLSYQKRVLLNKKTSLADILYYIFCFFIIISAQRGDWSQYTVIIFWYYFIPMYCMSLFSKNKECQELV